MTDFSHLLATQLESFGVIFYEEYSQTYREIFTSLRSVSQAEKELLSEVLTLAKLALVLPATNSVSECLFSALSAYKPSLETQRIKKGTII